MNKIGYTFFCLLMQACWPAIPRNTIVDPPPLVPEALEISKEVLEKYHGPLQEFDGSIIWMEGKELVLEGKIWDDYYLFDEDEVNYIGLYTPEFRTVYVLKRDMIGRSAFAHELIHYWMDVSGVDDPCEHYQEDWWKILPEMNEAIIEMEMNTDVVELQPKPHDDDGTVDP